MKDCLKVFSVTIEPILITLKDYFSPQFRWEYIIYQLNYSDKQWCQEYFTDKKDSIGLMDLALQVCNDGDFKALSPPDHPIYGFFTHEEKDSIFTKQKEGEEELEATQMKLQALQFIRQ